MGARSASGCVPARHALERLHPGRTMPRCVPASVCDESHSWPKRDVLPRRLGGPVIPQLRQQRAHPRMGGETGFRSVIQAAHARGAHVTAMYAGNAAMPAAGLHRRCDKQADAAVVRPKARALLLLRSAGGLSGDPRLPPCCLLLRRAFGLSHYMSFFIAPVSLHSSGVALVALGVAVSVSAVTHHMHTVQELPRGTWLLGRTSGMAVTLLCCLH